MEINCYPVSDEVVVVALKGQLDSSSSQAFFKAFDQSVEDKHLKVIIDCTGVDFISSMGLATLVRLHTRMKRKGGKVKLAGVGGPVQEVLAMTRLDNIFGIYPEVSGAHAAFMDNK